jgi:hypoxanthine phosphoribosyltransferase
MRRIKIQDKEFKIFIPAANIKRAVENIALQINNEYFEQEVLFIVVLNGAFMFSAELLKSIKLTCKVSFVKLASYVGNSTTGNVKEIIGLTEDIKDKHIVVIEDIVDTGNTIEILVKQLKQQNPASVKVATLLFKPQSYLKNMKIDYVGLEIVNEFVIGFGLDFNGYGRNYENIYALIEKKN